MTIIIPLLQMSDMFLKRLLFFFAMLGMAVCVDAQGKRGGFTPERFQAELEQYIVEKACLTPKEAAAFFPVYREMREKQRGVHKKMKGMKRIKPVTDEECKKCIKMCDEAEIEMKEIQKAYHDKFIMILPARKVYDILNAEDKFHRQIFKRAANKERKK